MLVLYAMNEPDGAPVPSVEIKIPFSPLVMLRCTAKRCLEARMVAMSSFEARLWRAPQDDGKRGDKR
jgi:hypothetical protein